MRTRGTPRLRLSACSAVESDWSTHSKTGRTDAAERSTHLRRARSVPHPPRKLAEHRLGLRGRRFDSKGRNRSRQDQGPQDSELPLFHVLYLPGAVLAVVLASGAAFTVKSAVREMV